MKVRIAYCITGLLMCVVAGLLFDRPVTSLIAQTEREETQEQTDSAAGTPGTKKTARQILKDAVQRELNSTAETGDVRLPVILPATTTHQVRKQKQQPNILVLRNKRPQKSPNLNRRQNPSTKQVTRNAPRRTQDDPRNSSEFFQAVAGTAPPENEAKHLIVNAVESEQSQKPAYRPAGENKSPGTVPAGFLNFGKKESGEKEKPSLLKRAISGLNRRSDPASKETDDSRESAPRRFIPTNPKPFAEGAAPLQKTAEGSSRDKIIQVQQNSAISQELEKLYRKDGREMPQFRLGTGKPAYQGNDSSQGFTPNHTPGHQPVIQNEQKRPFWKRLFNIGRKPQQRQQPRAQQNQPPQQLPRIPPPNYGSRNHPAEQNPRSNPYGRQNSTNISRNPGPFPGGAPDSGEIFGEQLQPLNQQNGRINGDAPQFNPFSRQFDPFADPEQIAPQNQTGEAVNAGDRRKSDPLSDEFNPFDEPENSVGGNTAPAGSNQQSTADPNSEQFNPFATPGQSSQETRTESSGPVQEQTPAGSDPLNEDFNPFDEPEPEMTDQSATTTTEEKPTTTTDDMQEEFNPFAQPEETPEEKTIAPPPEENTDRGTDNSAQKTEPGFPNPFPDVSETEADSNNPGENPFTGLKLTDEPEDLKTLPQVPEPEKISTPETSEQTQQTAPEIQPADPPQQTKDEQKNETKTAVKQPKKEDNSKKWKRISERFGLKGFKGFCPVALRDKRELIDSDPEFRASFELRTYFFSSEEAKETFEKNPELYAPAQGGQDIVMLLDDEKQVRGSLDHAVWFKDRLYMFSTAESFKTFLKKPKEYLKRLAERSEEETL